MGRRHVWLFALRGVISIVFGLVAVLWPDVTVVVLALLFGLYIVVDGIGAFIGAFRRGQDTAGGGARVLAGLLSIAAGVLVLVWPGITVLALALLIPAWALVTGLLDIWAATREGGQLLLIAVGTLSMVAGAFILFRPTVGATAIALVIGIYAIIAGVLTLAEAWREYRSSRTPRHRPAPAAG
jgi:uncharacterized membrane protein HdeD (DUF308 family)